MSDLDDLPSEDDDAADEFMPCRRSTTEGLRKQHALREAKRRREEFRSRRVALAKLEQRRLDALLAIPRRLRSVIAYQTRRGQRARSLRIP